MPAGRHLRSSTWWCSTRSPAVHRVSMVWRRPSGHAPCVRCRRSFAGSPGSRDVLVRLDRHGRGRSSYGRPCCSVVARAMDTMVLVRLVVGGSRARADRVRLPHAALVSTLGRPNLKPQGEVGRSHISFSKRLSSLLASYAYFLRTAERIVYNRLTNSAKRGSR